MEQITEKTEATTADKGYATMIYVFAVTQDGANLYEFRTKSEFDAWMIKNPQADIRRVIRGYEKEIRVRQVVTFI